MKLRPVCAPRGYGARARLAIRNRTWTSIIGFATHGSQSVPGQSSFPSPARMTKFTSFVHGRTGGPCNCGAPDPGTELIRADALLEKKRVLLRPNTAPLGTLPACFGWWAEEKSVPSRPVRPDPSRFCVVFPSSSSRLRYGLASSRNYMDSRGLRDDSVYYHGGLTRRLLRGAHILSSAGSPSAPHPE